MHVHCTVPADADAWCASRYVLYVASIRSTVLHHSWFRRSIQFYCDFDNRYILLALKHLYNYMNRIETPRTPSCMVYVL